MLGRAGRVPTTSPDPRRAKCEAPAAETMTTPGLTKARCHCHAKPLPSVSDAVAVHIPGPHAHTSGRPAPDYQKQVQEGVKISRQV